MVKTVLPTIDLYGLHTIVKIGDLNNVKRNPKYLIAEQQTLKKTFWREKIQCYSCCISMYLLITFLLIYKGYDHTPVISNDSD